MLSREMGKTLRRATWEATVSPSTLRYNAGTALSDLKPGDYVLQWEGNGPDVQVKVIKGKNVVATVPAKLAQGKSGYGNAITTRTAGNVMTLDEVSFAGGKQSLVFGEATAMQSSSGQ